MFLVQQVYDEQIVDGYDKYIRSNNKKCDIFEKILKKSNVDIEWINKKQQPYNFKMPFSSGTAQVNLYLSCVTYLGKPHPKYKKRMQLSDSADRSFLEEDNTQENITLMIGLYLYDENNIMFVAWDSSSNKQAGKSKSSHVYTNDILLATKNGVSQRKDKNGNNIYCFKPEYLNDFINYNYLYLEHQISFIEYLNEFNKDIDEYMFLDGIVDYLKEDLIGRNSVWDGKECLKEMKDNNYRNWAQTEWQGFFLEYLMQKELNSSNSKIEQLLEIPGPKYGKTVFDSFYNIPWDFKVHVNDNNQVITNDMEAIESALNDYGKIGFIILSGDAEKEIETEFSDWRNELKGGLSKNQLDNIAKNKKHRKLKTKFTPTEIKVITIDNNGLTNHGILRGLKNPNGNIRRDKLVINLDKLTEEEIILSELLSD